MKRIVQVAAMVTYCLAPLGLAAQETPPPANQTEHYYRLNFTVEEANSAGSVTNARSYVATVVTEPSTQTFKTGERVPIATGKAGGDTQVTYIDVGVNFEVHQMREVGDKLSFRLKTEMSSIANETVSNPGVAGDPLIRQNSWDSTVEIPIGKPTIVFSADDLQDKGKMQVELTATRLP